MLYVGMDAGGSRSRAAVVDAAGTLLGAAEGAGGNPVSHAPDQAFSALAGALRSALAGLPAGAVRGVVLGLAGAGAAGPAVVAARLAAVCAEAGLDCPVEVVGDVVVAFAAGTAEVDGTVLVAGTGATAARIASRREVEVADGHGWLLGDEGSGFWLGREAVRAALTALDRRGRPTALLPAVTGALLGAPLEPAAGRTGAERVVDAVHREPPIALARLAPLVSAAAAGGDEVATGIVDRAAAALVAAVGAVRGAAERTPVVVSGSVAGGANPVGTRTRAALQERWPGCVRTAGDAARAAAWLAAVRSGLPAGRAAALHGALVAGDRDRSGDDHRR